MAFSIPSGETPDGKLHRGSAPLLRLKPSEQTKWLVSPFPMDTECPTIMLFSSLGYNQRLNRWLNGGELMANILQSDGRFEGKELVKRRDFGRQTGCKEVGGK